MKPFVCAILVNYNGKADTEECVKSLLNAGYDNLKIIIVDNASATLPAEYNDVIRKEECEILFMDDNIGFAGANNRGIERAFELNADYVLIINNDTVVTEGFLEPMLDAFEKQENLGMVTGKILYYDEPEILWFGGGYYDEQLFECKIDGIGKEDDECYNCEKEIPYATACLWLIPVNTIKKVGLMSEDYFLYYEDADYCERVKNSGFRIWYAPQAVIYHKESRSTKKGSDSYQYYNNRNYLKFIKTFRTKKEQKIAYVKRFIRMAKNTLRGRMSAKVMLCVISDTIKGNYGKRDLNA